MRGIKLANVLNVGPLKWRRETEMKQTSLGPASEKTKHLLFVVKMVNLSRLTSEHMEQFIDKRYYESI
jgi:hypothetical protein